MGRENCTRCYILDGKMVCDFCDYGCMQCGNIKTCPDGLDEEEEYEEDY